MNLPTTVLDQLICYKCQYHLSYYPIYITEEHGHSICGRCDLQNHTCLDNMRRNVAYETLAKTMVFPCAFRRNGCLKSFTPENIPSHEDSCAYALFKCPVVLPSKECRWEGNITSLLKHFQACHIQNFKEENLNDNCKLQPRDRDFFILKVNHEHFAVWHYLREDACLISKVLCLEDSTPNYTYQILYEEKQEMKLTKELPLTRTNYFSVQCSTLSQMYSRPPKMQSFVRVKYIIRKSTSIPKDVNPSKEEILTNCVQANNDALCKFECPVCFEYMISKIFQCVNGHSICENCKNSIDSRLCPTCKDPIENKRNFLFEDLSKLMLYPCKFTKEGCTFRSTPDYLTEHQTVCSFGPQECPLSEYTKCDWCNSTSDLLTHVESKHKSYILETSQVSLNTADGFLETNSGSCHVLLRHNEIFLLHWDYQNEMFRWGLQVLNRTPDKVKNFNLVIEIIDSTFKNQQMLVRKLCTPGVSKNECFELDVHNVCIKLQTIRSMFTNILTYRVNILEENDFQTSFGSLFIFGNDTSQSNTSKKDCINLRSDINCPNPKLNRLKLTEVLNPLP